MGDGGHVLEFCDFMIRSRERFFENFFYRWEGDFFDVFAATDDACVFPHEILDFFFEGDCFFGFRSSERVVFWLFDFEIFRDFLRFAEFFENLV